MATGSVPPAAPSEESAGITTSDGTGLGLINESDRSGGAADAVAVLLNVTVDADATAESYITLWPAGTPRPTTSVINPKPTTVVSGSILVPLGAGGAVSVFNFAGAVNVIVDLAGYTLPISAGGVPGPQGAPGPPGPAVLPQCVYTSRNDQLVKGTADQWSTLVVTVPAGTYLFSADATVFTSGASAPIWVDCRLTDSAFADVHDTNDTPLHARADIQDQISPHTASVHLGGVVTFDASTGTVLLCQVGQATNTIGFADATMSFVPLGAAIPG